MMDQYTLVLGLPHTNHRGLAEHLLLQQAGHFHWTSLARAIGMPLSALRTPTGQEVYATFYFIEERFPEHAHPDAFQLDDQLRFALFLRAFKGIAAETRIVFDHEARLSEWCAANPARISDEDAARHPYIRLATIFITPEAGNSCLKVVSSAGIDFSRIAVLPNDDNPYQLTRLAKETGQLGIFDDAWHPVAPVEGWETAYAIDVDRDTNGAGLFYFANYVAIMDRAERGAMHATSPAFSDQQILGRDVQQRRVAYFGNVSTSDRLRTRVFTFLNQRDPSRVGFRYEMRREEDLELICLSEAIKVLGREPDDGTGAHAG
jgi:probable biosynthetic protein (TIGR04098 family)